MTLSKQKDSFRPILSLCVLRRGYTETQSWALALVSWRTRTEEISAKPGGTHYESPRNAGILARGLQEGAPTSLSTPWWGKGKKHQAAQKCTQGDIWLFFFLTWASNLGFKNPSKIIKFNKTKHQKQNRESRRKGFWQNSGDWGRGI